jgi:hypothetical protein
VLYGVYSSKYNAEIRNILSRVRVTADMFWIENWIYFETFMAGDYI